MSDDAQSRFRPFIEIHEAGSRQLHLHVSSRPESSQRTALPAPDGSRWKDPKLWLQIAAYLIGAAILIGTYIFRVESRLVSLETGQAAIQLNTRRIIRALEDTDISVPRTAQMPSPSDQEAD